MRGRGVSGPDQVANSYRYSLRLESGRVCVAIFVDPYGQLSDVRPVLQKAWTANFMAITGKYAGGLFLFVCVYAPHQRAHREGFFSNLSELELPPVEKIIVGGDFNCTLDARLDRSYFRSATTHASPALSSLIAKWLLVDAVRPPEDLAQNEVAGTISIIRIATFYRTGPTRRPDWTGGMGRRGSPIGWYALKYAIPALVRTIKQYVFTCDPPPTHFAFDPPPPYLPLPRHRPRCCQRGDGSPLDLLLGVADIGGARCRGCSGGLGRS